MTSRPGDIHVLPTNDLVDHEEHERECWCQPDVVTICDECPGDDPICWKCGGTDSVPDDGFQAVLVLHNAADGRE